MNVTGKNQVLGPNHFKKSFGTFTNATVNNNIIPPFSYPESCIFYVDWMVKYFSLA